MLYRSVWDLLAARLHDEDIAPDVAHTLVDIGNRLIYAAELERQDLARRESASERVRQLVADFLGGGQ